MGKFNVGDRVVLVKGLTREETGIPADVLNNLQNMTLTVKDGDSAIKVWETGYDLHHTWLEHAAVGALTEEEWAEFKKGKLAVRCITEEDAEAFLADAKEQGLTWAFGDSATAHTYWDVYKDNTHYSFNKRVIYNGIVYGGEGITDGSNIVYRREMETDLITIKISNGVLTGTRKTQNGTRTETATVGLAFEEEAVKTLIGKLYLPEYKYAVGDIVATTEDYAWVPCGVRGRIVSRIEGDTVYGVDFGPLYADMGCTLNGALVCNSGAWILEDALSLVRRLGDEK